jgi:hypothetical protein
LPEQESELRSGIIAGFNKRLSEALQTAIKMRFFLQNKVAPTLLTGILKGTQGTPGLVAAISAEQDTTGNIRLATSQLTALKGKTLIFKTDTANNATVALYTVPTGKTFYLLHITCGMHGQTANQIGLIHIGADSDNRLLIMKSDITAVYHPLDEKFVNITFPTPIPFPAGTVINAFSDSANLSLYPTIVGYLEDA